MRTPTPNPTLSQSSATGSDETRSRMDNEQPGTNNNGEAIIIGVGGSGGSDHRETADREGSDDSGDGGNDEMLQSIEPATQPVSTLEQSSGDGR